MGSGSGGVASPSDFLARAQFSDDEIAGGRRVNRAGVYCGAHIHPDHGPTISVPAAAAIEGPALGSTSGRSDPDERVRKSLPDGSIARFKALQRPLSQLVGFGCAGQGMVGEKPREPHGDATEIETLFRVLPGSDRADVSDGGHQASHPGELIGPLAAGGDQPRQIERPNAPPGAVQQVGDPRRLLPDEPGDLSHWERKAIVQQQRDLRRGPDRRVRAERQSLQESMAGSAGGPAGFDGSGSE